jgi:hypothetical protein
MGWWLMYDHKMKGFQHLIANLRLDLVVWVPTRRTLDKQDN